MKLSGFLIGLGLVLAGVNARASDPDESSGLKFRNGDYYLLHQLMESEADVAKIMLIKNAAPEIGAYTKAVSALAGESLDALDKIRQRDPAIRFDDNQLPAGEIAVRASIKADKQHQLLFGTTGPAFERALLVSQLEATMYAKNLAKVLAEHESGDRTREALEKISEKWAHENDRAYALLGNL